MNVAMIILLVSNMMCVYRHVHHVHVRITIPGCQCDPCRVHLITHSICTVLYVLLIALIHGLVHRHSPCIPLHTVQVSSVSAFGDDEARHRTARIMRDADRLDSTAAAAGREAGKLKRLIRYSIQAHTCTCTHIRIVECFYYII